MARVLVVDDVALIRAIVCDVLRVEGFWPIPCESGETALEVIDFLRDGGLEDGLPEVAVVDHHMPGMTGAHLIGELRARGLSFPVIGLTGRREGPAAMRAAGAALVLEKPFHRDPLLAALREVLGTASVAPRSSALV